MELTGKPVSASRIDDQFRQIFPGDLNPMGTVFGGKVLADADEVAAMAALSHVGQTCVTLMVDSVKFIAPGRQGEVLVYKASVNRTWGSSLEVGIKCCARNFLTGEKRHIFSAYFTFVALDAVGKPTPVPAIIPETMEDNRRYQEAQTRRDHRLTQRKK